MHIATEKRMPRPGLAGVAQKAIASAAANRMPAGVPLRR